MIDRELFLSQYNAKEWKLGYVENQYQKRNNRCLIQFDNNGNLILLEFIWKNILPSIIVSLSFDCGTLHQETYTWCDSGLVSYAWDDQCFTWFQEPNVPLLESNLTKTPFVSKRSQNILLIETEICGYHAYYECKWNFDKYLTEDGAKYTESEIQPCKRKYDDLVKSGEWLHLALSS